ECLRTISEPGIRQRVWTLIQLLPPNAHMRDAIEELALMDATSDNPSDIAWSDYFDGTSLHKLLYALQVTRRVLQHSEQRADLRRVLVRQGGLCALVELLLDIDF